MRPVWIKGTLRPTISASTPSTAVTRSSLSILPSWESSTTTFAPFLRISLMVATDTLDGSTT